MPFIVGSTTAKAKPVATAASAAFPPISNILLPTAVASGCAATTIPCFDWANWGGSASILGLFLS